MAIPPQLPLLRLNAPSAVPRRTSGGFPRSRKFTPDAQADTAAGQKLTHLAELLDDDTPILQSQADPAALPPERLLVVALTGRLPHSRRSDARRVGEDCVSNGSL